MGRELESGIPDRKADSIAALANGRVGKSHHRERRQAERHVDFNLNRICLDAEDRGRSQSRKHAAQIASDRACGNLRDS
jgi:hypothetical protein